MGGEPKRPAVLQQADGTWAAPYGNYKDLSQVRGWGLYMHTYICIYIYLCIFMYLYLYIYLYVRSSKVCGA